MLGESEKISGSQEYLRGVLSTYSDQDLRNNINDIVEILQNGAQHYGFDEKRLTAGIQYALMEEAKRKLG
jgi:hypothetical protein